MIHTHKHTHTHPCSLMMYVAVVSGEEGGNPAVEALMNSGNYLMENSVWVPHPPAFSCFV